MFFRSLGVEEVYVRFDEKSVACYSCAGSSKK